MPFLPFHINSFEAGLHSMPLAICFWWCCSIFQGFRTLETWGQLIPKNWISYACKQVTLGEFPLKYLFLFRKMRGFYITENFDGRFFGFCFYPVRFLRANHQLTVGWVSKTYQKNGSRKGWSDIYKLQGWKNEIFEWSRSRLLPHIDNNMTISLSLLVRFYPFCPHFCCPFDLPRCCESQWRSWHFKQASNPTQATVWDLCMGVSAKQLLQVTHHPEAAKSRTSN